MADAGADRPPLPGRARAAHRLRDVLPRRPDRRRGRAGARARARAAAGRRAPRPAQPRGRDAADARGGTRVPGTQVVRDCRRGEPDRAAVRRGDRLDARGGEELLPHRELHMRGGGTCGAARRGCRVAVRRRCGGHRATRFPSPTTNAGSSPVPAATGRRRRRPCSSCAKVRSSRPRTTRPSSYSTATWRRSTSRVRCFVLEGEGRAAERAHGAVAALEALGCDATLVPTVHPVVDIVRFQVLTVELAAARGVDPDLIRRDDERWARARAAYE